MNKKEFKEYQDRLMQGAKGSMGIGILSGISGNITGNMPASGTVNSAMGFPSRLFLNRR